MLVMTELKNLQEHCAVRSWSQLRPQRTEPASIEIIKQGKTSAVYRLAGVGANGSDVLAKKCPAAAAAVERTVYEELLTRVPIPTLRTYGWVQDLNDDYCWVFLEDPGDLAYSPLSDQHRALAGRWLGTIHSAAVRVGLNACLPRREPSHYLRLLRTSRSKIRQLLTHPALSEEASEILRRIISHCDVIESRWDCLEDICRDLRWTVVHGDFAAKNVRVKMTQAGPALVVLDWGIAGWGTPATDLAQFTGQTVSPDFTAYCSAMEEFGTPMDPRAVQRLADCGKIFRLLDAIGWACCWNVSDPYSHLKKPISLLRRYTTRLTDAMRAVWGTESDTSAITSRLVEQAGILRKLQKIVNRLIADPAMREDLMQEGFIRLWKLEVEQPGRTRSWYLQNCKFHLQHWLELGRSLDSQKRVRADKCVTLDGADDDLLCPTEDGFFEVVSARDIVSTLSGHLDPCESAVVGGLADGLRLQEIAVKLNLSYPTVLKYRRKIAALTVKLGISTPSRTMRPRTADGSGDRLGSESRRALAHRAFERIAGRQTGTRSQARHHCQAEGRKPTSDQ
jgi:DNA-directed RNA polymerase specialized sigma24 family protein